MDITVIDLAAERTLRAAKPRRLLPDLDSYSCLIDFGLGAERHSVLAWALLENDTVSGMILYNGGLCSVTQLAPRFLGYCDCSLNRVDTQPPRFIKPGLLAALDHFDSPHEMQCPDMEELSVACVVDGQWRFQRLQMWHLRAGDVAPMIDCQGPDGRVLRMDARRQRGFAGLVNDAQIGQIKAGGPIGVNFYGLLAAYRS